MYKIMAGMTQKKIEKALFPLWSRLKSKISEIGQRFYSNKYQK